MIPRIMKDAPHPTKKIPLTYSIVPPEVDRLDRWRLASSSLRGSDLTEKSSQFGQSTTKK